MPLHNTPEETAKRSIDYLECGKQSSNRHLVFKNIRPNGISKQ